MRPFRRLFANRNAAGIELAHAIHQRAARIPGLVLGLPAGGVPVAYEIARTLGVPLDVMSVRKIGSPRNPEVAIGAIAGRTVIREAGLSVYWPANVFAELARLQRAELRRHARTYRAGLLPLKLKGMAVLLVGDGLATGCMMLAAVREARRLDAKYVMVAAPVASGGAEALVHAEVEQTIILRIEPNLSAVGDSYQEFSPVQDAEILELLARSRLSAGLRAGC